MISERVPSELRNESMVLVQVISIVGEDKVRRKSRGSIAACIF